MTDKEIKEAKSLRWLAVQFPKVENPKDDIDRMQNCINLYCTNAAELINRKQAELDDLKRDTIPKLQEGLKRANKYGLETDKENEKLKAEIERLKEKDETRHKVFMTKCEEIETARAEAIKEFAERLKEFADNNDLYDRKLYPVRAVRVFDIDNLVKEMVGEDK